MNSPSTFWPRLGGSVRSAVGELKRPTLRSRSMAMTDPSPQHALIVPLSQVQRVRAALEADGQWDAGYSLKKDNTSKLAALPIKVDSIQRVRQNWPLYKVVETDLTLSSTKAKATHIKTPAEVLKRHIADLLQEKGLYLDDYEAEIPHKWEKHGDLIILPAHAFSSQLWTPLGSELWFVVARALACKRLARASTITNNGFRSSGVTLLLGKSGIVTHVDNKIKYCYDVTKCMFSAGNITEKLRIGSLDCKGETVVDLFSGIGYFTLPYLVHAGASHVHACDWNPDALDALRNNLRLNQVEDRCTVHHGDNRQLDLKDVADRVNLGLIPTSEVSWPVAVQVLKPEGGILHIHGNVNTKCPAATSTLTQTTASHLNSSVQEKDVDPSRHFSDKVVQFAVEKLNANRTENFHVQKFSDTRRQSDSEKIQESFENERSETLAIVNNKPQIADEHFKTKEGTKLTPDYTLESFIEDKNVRQGDDNDHRDASSICSSKPTNTTSKKEHIHASCQQWSSVVAEKILKLLQSQKGGDWSVKELHLELVKSYAPHVMHVVLDLECRLLCCGL